MRISTTIYLFFAAGILGFYLFSETRGLVYASTDTKTTIPAGASKSRRSYRSHSFWFVGYRGGK